MSSTPEEHEAREMGAAMGLADLREEVKRLKADRGVLLKACELILPILIDLDADCSPHTARRVGALKDALAYVYAKG